MIIAASFEGQVPRSEGRRRWSATPPTATASDRPALGM